MRIILFTTPTCHPCRLVKRKLEAAGVPFTVVDLTQAADELARLKGPTGAVVSTPTLEVDGEVVMTGLNPAVLDEVIARAKEAA